MTAAAFAVALLASGQEHAARQNGARLAATGSVFGLWSQGIILQNKSGFPVLAQSLLLRFIRLRHK